MAHLLHSHNDPLDPLVVASGLPEAGLACFAVHLVLKRVPPSRTSETVARIARLRPQGGHAATLLFAVHRISDLVEMQSHPLVPSSGPILAHSIRKELCKHVEHRELALLAILLRENVLAVPARLGRRLEERTGESIHAVLVE